MCFLRKKKKEKTPIIKTKFQVGDAVYFRRRDELMFGWIYEIHLGQDDKITYDIQVGGQCPSILYNFQEEELRAKK